MHAGPVNDTGTQLAVAWNESSSTATIVFKGSTSREDWLTVRPLPQLQLKYQVIDNLHPDTCTYCSSVS